MAHYENDIMFVRFTDRATGETWQSILAWEEMEEYIAELPCSAWEQLNIEVLPW